MKSFVKRLLRPGENPKEQSVRKRLGTVGSGVGVSVNALLAGLKLLVGTATGSVAVTADAINNLSDAASSVVSLVSMRLAQKPIDKEHPFGHGRLEYLGALAVGVMILVMGVEMLEAGVRSILNPEPLSVSIWPMVILVVSVLAKAGLYLFYGALGRMIDFDSLIAASKDSFSDMLATAAVILSMLLSLVVDFPVDGVMGLGVSLLVLKAGYEVVREMVDTLIGGKKNPELGREIITRLLTYEEILGTHDLLIHDYGPGRCIASVHAEVPADGELLHLHEVIDKAEHDIAQELNISICIHMDPIVTGDETTDAVNAHLNAVLQKLPEKLMLHDLRMVPGENRTNLVFDVAIPAGYTDTQRLTEILSGVAKEMDERYVCVIHYDIDYYHG